MKFRHLALVSIVAAFSLLAFVLSTWMKPFNIQSTEQIGHSEQILCRVPTSSSVYLAEVKPKLAAFGNAAVSVFGLSLLLPQQKSVGSFEPREIAVSDVPRPLWLLHRSLLI